MLLALAASYALSSLACDVLRGTLRALPAAQRAAVLRPLRDGALSLVCEQLLRDPGDNVGAGLLLRYLTDELFDGLPPAAPLSQHALRCVPLMQRLCDAAAVDNPGATRAPVLHALTTLAATPAGARIVKTFTPRRVRDSLLAWLQVPGRDEPMDVHAVSAQLAQATKLSATERRDAAAAAQRWRQQAAAAGEASTVSQDRRSATSSPAAPLLRASRHAAQRRVAMAHARANVMLRCLLLHDRRDDDNALHVMRLIAASSVFFTTVSPDASTPGAAPFSHTIGIAHMSCGRAPELLVVTGRGSEHAGLLRGIALNTLGWLLSAVCMAGSDCAFAQLLDDDQVPDAAVMRVDGASVMSLLQRIMPGDVPVPPRVAAAAARVTWLFREPCLARDAPAVDCAWAHEGGGAYLGRVRATFYRDAAAASEEELQRMPTLLCSLAESLAAAPHPTGLQVAQWLAQIGGGGDEAEAPGCACNACSAAAAQQRRCAYAACGCHRQPEPPALKRCHRYERVRYCSREAQAADWPRHKAECVSWQRA